MTTKGELIRAALGEFGITSAFDITPEELQDGIARMNRIAAQWDGQGIRVGYNFGTSSQTDAGIPDTAENALVLALAVQWAPSFGKTVGQDTRVAAKQAWNALYISRGVRPQMPIPPQLPMGQGSKRGVLSSQYFPEQSETTGLNDGAAEY